MQPKREKSNQVGEFECLTAVFRLIQIMNWKNELVNGMMLLLNME